MREAKCEVRAVLFDFGETLVNFGKINGFEIFRQGARLSYDFLKSCSQPVGNFQIYLWHSLLSLRFHYIISNITGNDFNALELLKTVAARKGISLTPDQWRQLVWLWYEPLWRIGRIEPDTPETLSQLRKAGIKLGIISNTFVNGSVLEKHLEQVGILDSFQVRLYSYQFNFRKPDPRIFIAAADKIGERLPYILYVGDRVDKDIKPALGLDMHAVLKNAYTNDGDKLPKGAWRINRLSELTGLVRKINRG
jgi:HAD superfamily hydrolase (TIGR01549 family)